ADSEENIVLQADGFSDLLPVMVQVWDFSMSRELAQSATTLSPDNGYHKLHTIQVRPGLVLKNKERFVYLKVIFQGFEPVLRQVLVSFHQGYIFIQTDKPIYNPGDKGPDTLHLSTRLYVICLISGTWTVTAKFDNWEQNTFNSTFEVKKYVLPAFNVTLTPQKPFFSVDDSELVVTITARYLYGQPVQGKAYVMFGVKHAREKIRLRAMKQVTNVIYSNV
uniref:Macroglobulin domain-containing protein n=1 Tax=Periophthalmus magnuspinnatus TaxID=409849 RepID=A0A3B4ALL6_9GOBI